MPVVEEIDESETPPATISTTTDESIDVDGISQQVLLLKENGNREFKNKNHDAAVEYYTQAIDTLHPLLSSAQGMTMVITDPSTSTGDVVPQKMTQFLCVLYANRAACRMQQNWYVNAIVDCSWSLALQSSYTKAIYRRTQAYEAQAKHLEIQEDAVTDIKVGGKKEVDTQQQKSLGEDNKKRKVTSSSSDVRLLSMAELKEICIAPLASKSHSSTFNLRQLGIKRELLSNGAVSDNVMGFLELALLDCRMIVQIENENSTGGSGTCGDAGKTMSTVHKQATAAAKRCRELVQALRVKRSSHLPYWQKLSLSVGQKSSPSSSSPGDTTATTISTREQISLIHTLMSMYMRQSAVQWDLIVKGFPTLLMGLVLPEFSNAIPVSMSESEAAAKLLVEADGGNLSRTKDKKSKIGDDGWDLRICAAHALRSCIVTTSTAGAATTVDGDGDGDDVDVDDDKKSILATSKEFIASIQRFVLQLRLYIQRISRPFLMSIAHQMDKLANEMKKRHEKFQGEEKTNADAASGESKTKAAASSNVTAASASGNGYDDDSIVGKMSMPNGREAKFINVLIGLMARIASKAEFDFDIGVTETTSSSSAAEEKPAAPSAKNLRRILLEDLLILLQVPCVVDREPLEGGVSAAAADDGLDTKRRSVPITSFERARIKAVLQGLAIMADSDLEALKMVRAYALPHLLFSRLVRIDILKSALTACLVMITKARGNQKMKNKSTGKKDKDGKSIIEGANDADDDILKPKKDKYGNEVPLTDEEQEKKAFRQAELIFQEQVARFLIQPLLSPDPLVHRKAMRALSLLLQANPTLGIHVVTHKPPEGTDGATNPLRERVKQQVEEMRADGVEIADEDAALEVDEKKLPPAALHMLIMMTLDRRDNADMYLAAECLALASSDPLVRESIAQSSHIDVFFQLIEHRDPLIAMHAGLALSRMAAVGSLEEDSRDRIFQSDAIIRVIIDVIGLYYKQHERLLERLKKKLGQGADLDSALKLHEEEGDDDDDEAGTTNQEQEYRISGGCLRDAVESLSYLSLNVQAKQLMCGTISTIATGEGSKKGMKVDAASTSGAWLDTLLKLFAHRDIAVRYGAISIFYNCCTSHDDIQADYDHEVEELRKVARKGLPGIDEKKEEELLRKAGEQSEINAVIARLCERGGITALLLAFRRYVGEADEALDDIKAKRLREHIKLQTQIAKSTGRSAKKKDLPQQRRIVAPFQRLNGLRIRKNQRDDQYSKDDTAEKRNRSQDNDDTMLRINHVNGQLAQSMARSLLRMSRNPELRGRMVQQGAIKLLLYLCRHEEEKAHMAAAHALGRITISVNPVLYDGGELLSMIVPLLGVIELADTELVEFESTLGITNLASFDEEVQQKMMKEGAWSVMSNLLGSDNEQIQRAAVQCMTNLITSDACVSRLLGWGGHQDIKIMVLFSGSTDHEAAEAAAGALAMISSHPELAKKIGIQKGVEHFVCSIASPELPLGIRHRINVCIQNMARFWLDEELRESEGCDCNPVTAPAEDGLKLARDLVNMKPVFDKFIEEYEVEVKAEEAKRKAEQAEAKARYEETERERKAKLAAEEAAKEETKVQE